MEVAVVWSGSEALKDRLVPIESLTDHPQNPRHGDVEMIAESLARFGQVRPILIDTYDRIIAGHHVRKAARLLGWTHVAVDPNSFDTVAEAKAYLLADNRLSELGSIDRQQQLNLLLELGFTEEALYGTGFNLDSAETLQEQLSMTAEGDTEFMGDYAETAEQRAAREEAQARGVQHREVVLLMTTAEYEHLGERIRRLQKEYGTGGIVATILEAVRREAAALDARTSYA